MRLHWAPLHKRSPRVSSRRGGFVVVRPLRHHHPQVLGTSGGSMAVRRRLVRPDAVLETQHGDVPYVTDQAYLEAVVAAAQTQALAGGVLSVIVDRTPTDLEHEMVTTAAVIEWRDRTDARPQPERSVPIEPTAPAIPQPGLFSETGEEETPAETAGLEEAATARDEHGFDYGQLEEEDVSSIPEAAR